MKRYIRAASLESIKGTTYYAVPLDMVLDYFSNKKENAWIWKSFDELGWDAIDFDHNLYGSQVIDDILYLCVTDSANIEVNGVSVDPEEALDIYAVEDLREFIEEPNDAIIKRYITEYEIFPPKFNEWASELLSKYDFTKLTEDYQEFDS